eukprot:GHVU01223638.1.p1 GENE.GHVU01223638.1~~GHVU01223638.1.p1  ORF type:complete len:265 (-),score=4.88 GHVU01223638.1:199-993(-)
MNKHAHTQCGKGNRGFAVPSGHGRSLTDRLSTDGVCAHAGVLPGRMRACMHARAHRQRICNRIASSAFILTLSLRPPPAPPPPPLLLPPPPPPPPTFFPTSFSSRSFLQRLRLQIVESTPPSVRVPVLVLLRYRDRRYGICSCSFCRTTSAISPLAAAGSRWSSQRTISVISSSAVGPSFGDCFAASAVIFSKCLSSSVRVESSLSAAAFPARRPDFALVQEDWQHLLLQRGRRIGTSQLGGGRCDLRRPENDSSCRSGSSTTA